MAVVHARSGAEAREYMALAMDDCPGQVSVERANLFRRDGRLVQTFVAHCLDTGASQEFAFTTDPPVDGTDPDAMAPGTRPSQLIDAGQWFLIAGRYVADARAAEEAYAAGQQDAPTVEQMVQARARARAALIEVLKFIPAGTQEPPADAFWTELGQRARREYGTQLSRAELEPIVAGIGEVLRQFQEAVEQAARDGS